MDMAVVNVVDGRVVGYLTASEFAKKHEVKEVTVHQWIHRGKISSVYCLKVGNRTWIKEEAIVLKKKKGRARKNEQ